jgi:uncharacterized protein (UPF0261 family)
MANKTIAILATLDTKGVEASYIGDQIKRLGFDSITVDVGVIDRPATHADISREQVAKAGGTTLEELLIDPSREKAAPIMASGAIKIIKELESKGKISGIVSMGGTQGTTLSTKVMRSLPYGFPKVMVSTMASGNVAPWVDIKDITMMFSVTDIMGLNPVMRKILANAAGAVCGMAGIDIDLKTGTEPLVAITTVGITTKGAMEATRLLNDAGYETIVFHAIGPGGRAMEQIMKEKIIGAVLDLSIIEVSNQMFGGLLAGNDERLTIAGKLGIPQVVCPGALEVLVFNEPETVPLKYQKRILIRHSPQITDLRLNGDEMALVGKEVAARLNFTKDKSYFMIPTGGFDSYAVKGGQFYDPHSDRMFIDELKANLAPNFEVIEKDTHIEDPRFIAEAVERLIYLIKTKSISKEG